MKQNDRTTTLSTTSFSNLVVFGDSLSDAGNVFEASGGLFPPSPPFANGRFSNGDLIVDIIADEFGLPENTSYLLGGSNYAFAGATTGEGTSFTGFFDILPAPIEVPNIAGQIDIYLSTQTPQETDLFYILGGGNDIVFTVGEGEQSPTPESLVDNITNNITELAQSGAKTFVVPNLPPLDIIPLFSDESPETIATISNITNSFNQLLDQQLDTIATDLNVTIIEPDLNSIVTELIANADQLGFTNTTQSVIDFDSGLFIGDPNEFFFWDFIHPTTAVNQIVATEVIENISLELARNTLSDQLIRFRNTDIPTGTYLFAGEEEANSVRNSFVPPFLEEGVAFNVSLEQQDGLVRFNRFRNNFISGTYIFASEEESIDIRANFGDTFTEEGTAFYTYASDAGIGEDVFRFRNINNNTYIFAFGDEARDIRANFSDTFIEEGVAFETIVA